MNMEEGDPASWRRAVPSYRQMSLAEIHFDTHGDTRHTKEKGKNNWSPTLQNLWS
jgi:arginase family enzyme